MICQVCKDQEHHLCRDGSWCDCQHRTRTVALVGHPGVGCTVVGVAAQDNDEAEPSPVLLDALDLALADTSTWVKRERPQRKDPQ